MRAVSHANRLIDWQENLSEGEFPPEWMLPFDEELTLWFDEVKRRRKAGYSPPSDDIDEEPPGGMIKNELVRGRR